MKQEELRKLTAKSIFNLTFESAYKTFGLNGIGEAKAVANLEEKINVIKMGAEGKGATLAKMIQALLDDYLEEQTRPNAS